MLYLTYWNDCSSGSRYLGEKHRANSQWRTTQDLQGTLSGEAFFSIWPTVGLLQKSVCTYICDTCRLYHVCSSWFSFRKSVASWAIRVDWTWKNVRLLIYLMGLVMCFMHCTLYMYYSHYYVDYIIICMHITDTRNIWHLLHWWAQGMRNNKCHTSQVFVIYCMRRARNFHYKKLSPPALYGKIFIYKFFFLC